MKQLITIFKINLWLIVILSSQFTMGQKRGVFGLENVYVNNVGTTKMLFGYSPVKNLEFYVAPSWSVFYGGVSMFADVKYNFLSEKRIYPSVGVGYRHSFKNEVSFENLETKGVESFRLPNRDFVNFQVGVNIRLNKYSETDKYFVLNLSLVYSQVLANKTAEQISGPFSNAGINAANNRLISGFGFSVALMIYNGY